MLVEARSGRKCLSSKTPVVSEVSAFKRLSSFFVRAAVSVFNEQSTYCSASWELCLCFQDAEPSHSRVHQGHARSWTPADSLKGQTLEHVWPKYVCLSLQAAEQSLTGRSSLGFQRWGRARELAFYSRPS